MTPTKKCSEVTKFDDRESKSDRFDLGNACSKQLVTAVCVSSVSLDSISNKFNDFDFGPFSLTPCPYILPISLERSQIAISITAPAAENMLSVF